MESSVNVPQSGFPSPPQILITNLKTSFIVISFMVNTKYRVQILVRMVTVEFPLCIFGSSPSKINE